MPYLSQRMKLLENGLTGEAKLRLTVSPSSLAQELRKCKGITNVAIWALPYDTMNYRLQNYRNARFIQMLDAYIRPFSGDTALANGRRLHMRGTWASDPPRRGAKAHYMACRVSDADIANIKFDEEIRRVLDIGAPVPLDDPNIEQFKMLQRARLNFFKRQGSYWLGQMAFEEERYNVAIDYFDKRTLQANPGGTFDSGARYGLARSYEQLGRGHDDPALIEKAIDIYEADDSPQAIGNKLRARRLKKVG
jgi:tetratricopeptide (TPR) repeat protein